MKEDRIMKLRTNCSIKTSQFTIQSRNAYEIEMDQIIAPYLWNETMSDDQLQEITKIPLAKMNRSDPILITEFDQLTHLIEQTHEQARKADYVVKFERIQDEATRTSIWSTVSGSLLAFCIMGPIIAYIAYKAGILRCGSRSSTNVTIVSTAGNTPYPTKKAARKDSQQAEVMI